jgi:hypothetical protein
MTTKEIEILETTFNTMLQIYNARGKKQKLMESNRINYIDLRDLEQMLNRKKGLNN